MKLTSIFFSNKDYGKGEKIQLYDGHTGKRIVPLLTCPVSMTTIIFWVKLFFFVKRQPICINKHNFYTILKFGQIP